jgi:hypothetical protein
MTSGVSYFGGILKNLLFISITSTHLQSVLARRFNAVVAKRAGLALALTGEVGIGKSFRVFQSFAEIQCQSASLHATSNEDTWARALPKAKKLPVWASRNFEKLKAGELLSPEAFVNTLVTNMVLLAPFVLHLEDAHEANPERLVLIEKLGQVVSKTKGVAVVVTSRHSAPEGFSSLQLLFLSKSESQVLLEHELGASLPFESLDYVFSRGRGNPLFTLEFLRYLTRQGFLWSDGALWHWRAPADDFVPVTIEALIENMISSCDNLPELRDVLEARAVVLNQLAEPLQIWLHLCNLSTSCLHFRFSASCHLQQHLRACGASCS